MLCRQVPRQIRRTAKALGPPRKCAELHTRSWYDAPPKRRPHQAPGLFSFYKWKCAHRQAPHQIRRTWFAARRGTFAGGFSGPDFTQQNAPPFSGAFINLWMYRIWLIGATVFDTIWALFFIRPGDGGFNFLQPLKRSCRQARIGGLKLRQPRAKRHGLRR